MEKLKPGMETKDGGLFLLEVLIDKVSFVKSPCFSDKDFRTCVTIEATAVEPLEICDDDPGACVAKSGGPFVKTFNSDPCVCGAAKVAGVGRGQAGTGPPCQHGGGHGGGPCPITQDPYNSTPCQDPDDICYCSGPRPPSKQPMVCRNMDQYCLHVPKGILPSLPIYQDLTEEQILEIKSTNKELKLLHVEDHFVSSSIAGSSIPCSETTTIIDEYITKSFTDTGFSTESIQVKLDHSASLCAIRSRRRSVSFSDKVDYASKSYSHVPNYGTNFCNEMPKSIFGKKVTTVYVTLFDDLCRRHTSGTQATASVNKCLQASQSKGNINYNIENHYVCSSSTVDSSVLDSTDPSVQDNRIRYSDIYFFGKNKSDKPNKDKTKGVGGTKTDKTKHDKTKTDKTKTDKTKTDKTKTDKTEAKTENKAGTVSRSSSRTSESVQAQPPKKVQSSAAAVQAQPPNTSASIQCYATCRAKSVSIRDTCKPCPGAVPGVTKGDVVATISHIKIGPREQCPVHGKEPCQGPKCVIAASGVNADDQAAVKVTTATNPRRGVFELVIRKLTGAPLARNELMLEWTPPPCRPPTCGSPCPTPCVLTPGCRPSKCKMIVCRPSPCRPAKCCKKPCGSPCRRCSGTSCGKPCSPCKPCKPCRPCVPASYLCRPCPTSPRCRPCPPRPRCSPCPPSPLCRPCPPLPRCRPCPPPRCRPCPPLPRCRPCPPPRCRPCPPPRCRPCPPPRCRPCPPPRCRPCPPPRCRPCPPPRCRPCPPSPRCRPCPPKPCEAPCAQPCGSPGCESPCKSSPCLRPCPVGYRKRHKIRCQPKIRAHRKLISPCLNRSKACPMVRCRSVPGPCVGCCGASPCTPRKCCSVFPWRPRKCPVYLCTTRKCSISPCPALGCPPLACPPLACPPLACPPLACPSLACPPLPCQVTPCPPVPCPPQKCCSASRYKIKNCCGQGCSNCCT
ncbi:hypothetical protein PYW08_000277 [Mythimna loreyi]|uniref:Uncharacterized protein n=1 Tax=Mythimna loreyi TaxID=667449 RepID=A0ACC2RC08_9NEOP|nr:hypothetical protein PYW08_000277 [Mythimna loreyi]